MTTPKPASPFTRARQLVVTELLNIRQSTITEVRVKNVKRGKDGIWRHSLGKVDVQVPTLAGNVSSENVFRTAEAFTR